MWVPMSLSSSLCQRGRVGGEAMAAWLAGAGCPPAGPGPGPGSTSCVAWDLEGWLMTLSCSAVLKLLKMAVGMRACCWTQ